MNVIWMAISVCECLLGKDTTSVCYSSYALHYLTTIRRCIKILRAGWMQHNLTVMASFIDAKSINETWVKLSREIFESDTRNFTTGFYSYDNLINYVYQM